MVLQKREGRNWTSYVCRRIWRQDMRSGLSTFTNKRVLQYSADVTVFNGKYRVAPMWLLSVSRLELQAAFMEVSLKEQIVKDNKLKINSCSFWSDSTTLLQYIHNSSRKQQVFVANCVAEILDITAISQWKHVSGINNPASIGTRAINIEELKWSERLNGPAVLKRQKNEWPQQVILIFALDEENINSAVFMTPTEETKGVIQWERFSIFNRIMNTVAYVEHALSQKKTNDTCSQHSGKRKSNSNQLRVTTAKTVWWREEISESSKENSKRQQNLTILTLPRRRRTYSRQRQIRQKSIGLQGQAANNPILLHCKHRVVELFLPNEYKYDQHKGTEDKKHCSAEDVDPRYMIRFKNRSRIITLLDEKAEHNDGTSNGRSTRRAVRCSDSLYKCWSWLLWPFHCEDWSKERKAMVLSAHMSNYEGGAYGSDTQVWHR